MATTLMVDYIISLDGYGAGEGWPGFWGLEGPEYLAWLGEDAQDGLIHLMGSTTYRLMAAFAGQSQDAGSQALDDARKIVFSSTLDEPLSWRNTELARGDAVTVVRELKDRETLPLRTLGPGVSSRPFSAWTTATGSPVISITTVTRPSAPIAAERNEESTAPWEADAANRDAGSSSGLAASAALEGRSSAMAPTAARMRRRKGGTAFRAGVLPHRGVTRLYGGYASPEQHRKDDERILIRGEILGYAMRVPGGSWRAGVRVRAHAHHSSTTARASCTPSPTNHPGTVWSMISSGVG